MTRLSSRAEIMAWRKSERRRLIEERVAIDAGERRHRTNAIEAHLSQFIGVLAGRSVSAYWPFRGEPDLRHWMESLAERGGSCALPVVIRKNAPLVFRAWHKGSKLAAGVWNIPVPAEGAEVVPDIVVAPLVGFDRACYRLGYGGGFYDRTLAALSPRPMIIGVGYAQAAITNINPLPHDIPMDVIVTEHDVIVRSRPPDGPSAQSASADDH
ncbi:MAG: 5-formyltetrahydrofolate cyclo-ligase [Rhodospirillales bacterium]|nr:5-formyltetrahydrofolate cyclo-ligase [Rhodospirillales bacterium]